MINQNLNNKITPNLSLNPKFLWFITVTYSMLSLLSNWFSICTISLQNININAGVLVYPITFLLSGFITEVYGYKNARRAVWCGLLFNLLSIFYALGIIALPSPKYAIHNTLFDSVITIYLKGIFIYIISYFIAEPFHVFFLSKLKLNMNGYHMKLRLALSTALSITISGVTFNFVKSYGPLIYIKLIPTMFFSILIMIISLPIITYLIEKVKQIEKIDIYDQNTQFNIFKFDVEYIAENNEFNN